MKTFPRRGQAIVEMAVLFPFFLALIVGGIVDFGFAFTNFIKLQQIANAAAQLGAEGKGSEGLTSAEISQFVLSQKPSYWSSAPHVDAIQPVMTSDGQAVVKVVTLSYVSPMYTPFYQTFLSAATGAPGLKLQVRAAYQVPNNVATD